MKLSRRGLFGFLAATGAVVSGGLPKAAPAAEAAPAMPEVATRAYQPRGGFGPKPPPLYWFENGNRIISPVRGLITAINLSAIYEGEDEMSLGGGMAYRIKGPPPVAGCRIGIEASLGSNTDWYGVYEAPQMLACADGGFEIHDAVEVATRFVTFS